ncbi:MAG: preprotein translocase subunit YajC [Pseudomonadota bacterium]
MLIASAHAQTTQGQASQAGAGDPFFLIMMVGLFAIMWFTMIRPQRKRQKEHAEMVSALGKGDEVVTTSGILGRINQLDDNYVVLSVADKVELKFQRVHVHAVLPKGTIKGIG